MPIDPYENLTVRQQRLFDKCMKVRKGDEEAAWSAIKAGAGASDADCANVAKALSIVVPNMRTR